MYCISDHLRSGKTVGFDKWILSPVLAAPVTNNPVPPAPVSPPPPVSSSAATLTEVGTWLSHVNPQYFLLYGIAFDRELQTVDDLKMVDATDLLKTFGVATPLHCKLLMSAIGKIKLI